MATQLDRRIHVERGNSNFKWTNSVAAAGEIEKKRIKERNMLNASCRTRLRSLVKVGQKIWAEFKSKEAKRGEKLTPGDPEIA